jgi:hypothetical protein
MVVEVFMLHLTAAMSIVSTVLQPLGWFAGAYAAHTFSLRADAKRDNRARRGTCRQITASLRMLVLCVDQFFYSFKNIQLNDVQIIYEKISSYMNEVNIAFTLSDEQYATMDAVVVSLGQAIVLAGHKVYEMQRGNSSQATVEDDNYARHYFATCFRGILPDLGKAATAFSDENLRSQITLSEARANECIKYLEQNINLSIERFDLEWPESSS